MDINLQEEYRRIGALYDTFASVLAWPDATLYRVNDEVSRWSPAKHLFHILRANGMMLKGIQLICQGHRIADNEGEPTRIWQYVRANGMVRGKAEAPESVVPPDEVSREELDQSLERSRARYAQTEAFLSFMPDAAGRIPHHIFGMLNASEWLHLVRIHSEHHLAIVRDIVGALDVGTVSHEA